MTPETADPALEIVRFVDGYQPGIVPAKFVDATGRSHTLIDKVPIFSSEDLKADIQYPQPGSTQCVVLERFCDGTGRLLARVRTIESTEELTEFVVLATQLSAPLPPR